MIRKLSLRGALALVAVVAGACASAPETGTNATEQLRFGVEMARRGLWSEALFRFEQSRQLRPGDPKVLNNIAVAYEAVGRFDDALATYKEAAAAAPGNRDVKSNYSRFLEFYQNYRGAVPTGTPPAAEPVVPPPSGSAR